MVILASEDIGNANPNALNLSVSTMQAVSKIGYPEAKIILSQCVIYLASSPKSNSAYNAINKAIQYLKNHKLDIPLHLKNHSSKYISPHSVGGYLKQTYSYIDETFYHSKGIGFEKTLNEWIKKIKSIF